MRDAIFPTRCKPLILAAALLAALPATAADDADEALIRRLEASGALDRAVDRAIERRVRRDVEQRRKAAEEQQARRQALAAKARPVEALRERIHGDPVARYSVIVYSDLECPYCKRIAGVPEKAVAAFGAGANVVWRHLPLEFHGKAAMVEAVAAECVGRQAGNPAFFGFVNAVLAATQSNGKGLAGGDEALRRLARDAGATDAAAFGACLGDAEVAQRIEADVKDAGVAGIDGTPAILLRDNAGGRSQLVGGALPAEQLERLLRAFADAGADAKAEAPSRRD